MALSISGPFNFSTLDQMQQFRGRKNRGGNIDIVRGKKKDNKKIFVIILL
jgi:hypothetical protein